MPSRVRDNRGVSSHPDVPPTRDGDQAPGQIGPVSVRRAPRYYRFMAVGAAIGLLLTLIVTFAYPEQGEFSRLQVIGFTALFIIAIFVALGAIVALVIDRISRRRARTVTVELVREHGSDNDETV